MAAIWVPKVRCLRAEVLDFFRTFRIFETYLLERPSVGAHHNDVTAGSAVVVMSEPAALLRLQQEVGLFLSPFPIAK